MRTVILIILLTGLSVKSETRKNYDYYYRPHYKVIDRNAGNSPKVIVTNPQTGNLEYLPSYSDYEPSRSITTPSGERIYNGRSNRAYEEYDYGDGYNETDNYYK